VATMNRPLALGIGAVALVAVVGGAVIASGNASSSPKPSGSDAAVVTPSPSTVTPEPTASPSPTASPTPTPVSTPTPVPTPTMVPDPLTGRMVTEAVAKRHPIAVMIDDLRAARPQSGFNQASIVWQAPAEGGIPRYMMIFAEGTPKSVGPVRSSRFYYIAWAAEWKAVYGHVGGSPQAMATLQQKGNGQYVYNADQFRWGGTYYHRIKTRFAPHNVYTDGKTLRKLAKRVGAKDTVIKPIWQFGPDAPLEARPAGGTIVVTYPQNKITYRYDRNTNTYLRGVTGETKQIDAADGKRVAPKNIVIMNMVFGPLNDGHPNKNRLEAQVTGSGKAWIATNGKTIKGTWKKKSITAPTQFFDAKGRPVTLTVGQTFIQVLRVGSGYGMTIKDGTVPTASPATSPSPSASAAS
jgi:Protein of unknown function (DUF3048) N-terminal domain/Protein of unknown function (DUF3048) C-terminal domain